MRPLQRSMAAGLLCATRRSKQRELQLCRAVLVRLLSDAADQHGNHHVNGCDEHVQQLFQEQHNGTNSSQSHSSSSAASMATLFDEDRNLDIESNAEHDEVDVNDFGIDPSERLDCDFDEPIRQETRQEAIRKTEQLLAVLRNSMTEMELSMVIKRVGQHAVNPVLNACNHAAFVRALNTKFGPSRPKELEYTIAFLEGRDEVMKELVDKHFLLDFGGSDYDGLKVAGLRPDLMADPRFISVVLYFCRVACLNSLSLIRHKFGNLPARSKKLTLGQVKKDFRRVLEAENLHQYVGMLGLELDVPSETKARNDDDQDDDDDEEYEDHEQVDDLVDDATEDEEWNQVNLEDDLIDFKMHSKQTQKIAQLLKENLSDETIALVINSMLNSVKSSRLHRKIFQEMVCEVGVLLPEEIQKTIISELIPFLSANNASWDDFQSVNARLALRHHRLRRQTILRSLLDCRMRVGQIEIPDLDVDSEKNLGVSDQLTKAQRELVVTTAWNLVSVIDERRYHIFFNRFIKHKLTWRPNQRTLESTFLANMRTILGKHDAKMLMPLLEKVHADLSVETLTICRIKQRQHQWMRHRASLTCETECGHQHQQQLWPKNQTVFYSNVPDETTEEDLRAGLRNVGHVERAFVFSYPDRTVPGRAQDDEEDHDLFGSDTTKSNSRRKKAELVIASDKPSRTFAAVQFSDPLAAERAMTSALRIFGVLIENNTSGSKPEKRAVFSTLPDDRCTIVLERIPFGTTIGEVLDQVKAIVSAQGLNLHVDCDLPRGVYVTKGHVELVFDCFQDAVHVVHFVHQHVHQLHQEIETKHREVRDVNARMRELHKELEKEDEKKRKKVEDEFRKEVEAAAEGKARKARKSSKPTKKEQETLDKIDQLQKELEILSTRAVEVPELPFNVTWLPVPKRSKRDQTFAA